MKIFTFDLDNTLLTSDKRISEETYKALAAWHEAGHVIAISSGRPLASILEVIDYTGLMAFSPYAIAWNGCQIYNCTTKETLHRISLSLEDIRTVAALAKEAGIYCHSYNDTHILTPCEGEELAFYRQTIHLPVKTLEHFPEGVTEEPCKMLCIDLNSTAALEALGVRINTHPALSGKVCALRSNARLLEVFPASAGKGSAIPILNNLLGISRENSYAAGDEQNDISMLQAAGCGIAMCNGHPDTVKAADIVTEKDSDHDGLAQYLLQFI